MAEIQISSEVLQIWAQDLRNAADIIKQPAVTAAMDQRLAEARDRLGADFWSTDVREIVGMAATDRDIAAAVLRAVAAEMMAEAGGG